MTEPVLVANDLCRDYSLKSGMFQADRTLHALRGATFKLHPGKTLAVVGESGCGKSTLARVVTMIEPATSGDLSIDNVPVGPETTASLRTHVQIVFQDPYGSLNPRQRIGVILEEPLKINRPDMSAEERTRRAREILELVGLRPEHFDRYHICSRAASASGLQWPGR